MITRRSLNASRQQPTPYGAALDSEFGPYGYVGSAREVLGQDVVNVQCLMRSASPITWRGWSSAFGGVAASMFSLGHQLKVLNVVVQGVAINVMNDLPSLQFAPQMEGHHNPVLVSKAPSLAKHPVARAFVDMTADVLHGHIVRRYVAAFNGGI